MQDALLAVGQITLFAVAVVVTWMLFSRIGAWSHRRRNPPPTPGSPVDADFRVVGEGRWEPLKRWWEPKGRVAKAVWHASPHVVVYAMIGLAFWLGMEWLRGRLG